MSENSLLKKIFSFKKEDENLSAEEYYEIGFDFLAQYEKEKAKYAIIMRNPEGVFLYFTS